MNWITKVLRFGEKIKPQLRKGPVKKKLKIATGQLGCKGPILKKDLEENLWVCSACNKHHRINCQQRFDIIFGKITMRY